MGRAIPRQPRAAGRIYNASDFNNNANVSMGAGSTLNVTGSDSNSIVSLGLGSGSTANFGGAATTIGTLSLLALAALAARRKRK